MARSRLIQKAYLIKCKGCQQTFSTGRQRIDVPGEKRDYVCLRCGTDNKKGE